MINEADRQPPTSGNVLPPFTGIDIEASGLKSGSFPVEVGWCRPGSEPHSLLIRPHASWNAASWDTAAERLHGISRAMVETEGLSVSAAAARLRSELSGGVLLSDACAFDQHWFDMLFRTDTQGPAPRLTDLYSWLGEQAKHLRIDFGTLKDRLQQFEAKSARPHRAGPDAARLCQMVEACLASTIAFEPDAKVAKV